MNTTEPRPFIRPSILPPAIVALDIEVQDAFLSDDLATICAVAGKIGSAVLIASAGQPRKNREAAFVIWRQQALADLAVTVPEIRNFLAGNETMRLEYEAATIDLIVLDRGMHDAREDERVRKSELMAHNKQVLRDAIAKHTPDYEENRFPRYCVIRGDGDLKLFRGRNAAQEWAREGNFGYNLVPLTSEMRESKIPT